MLTIDLPACWRARTPREEHTVQHLTLFGRELVTLALVLAVVFAFGPLSVADTALLVGLWCAVRGGGVALARRRHRHHQPTP